MRFGLPIPMPPCQKQPPTINVTVALPYNRRMTNLEILVPFALPPAEHARDLLAALQAPSFARLLSRASQSARQSHDAFASSLPHERWLAQDASNSPPLAGAALQRLNKPVEAGLWFMLQPANLHIARDHLVLTDRRQLGLADAESRRLFAAAEPLFAELGLTLAYGNAGCWFLRADAWQGLQTSSPDAACGHNIDIWLPRGAGERDWRKLLNELQMLWHTDPVNDEREARGAARINTVWLWGASALPHTPHTGLSLLAEKALGLPATSRFDATTTTTPALLDTLIAPAMAGDWSHWLNEFAELEKNWFMPLNTALSSGRVTQISLILTDSSRLTTWQAGSLSLRKFWIKPALKRLAS